MKKLTGFMFWAFSLLAMINVCLAADPTKSAKAELTFSPSSPPSSSLKPDGMRFPQVNPELAADQAGLKRRIEADYGNFERNYSRYWGGANLLNYLDFSTGVLKFSVVSAETTAQEILGVLRGALGAFPALTLEEKEEDKDKRAKEIIIRAFLATQIVRDLDTWRYWREDPPRYEVEEPALSLAMNGVPGPQDQYYILSAIALAARRKLLDPTADINDLRDHVKYFWKGSRSAGDLMWRDIVVERYITPQLIDWIEEMRDSFAVRALQKEDLARFRETRLTDGTLRQGVVVERILSPNPTLDELKGQILLHANSPGDGNQCGFFSLLLRDRNEFFDLLTQNLDQPFVAALALRRAPGFAEFEGHRNKLLQAITKGHTEGKLTSKETERQFIKENIGDFIDLSGLDRYERKDLENKEGVTYQVLKKRALERVTVIMSNYAGQGGKYDAAKEEDKRRLTRGIGTENDMLADANNGYGVAITKALAPLLQHIVRIHGIEPFRDSIIIPLHESIRRDYQAGHQDGELTFPIRGQVVYPLSDDYEREEPTCGLFMHGNIYAWVTQYYYTWQFYKVGGNFILNTYGTQIVKDGMGPGRAFLDFATDIESRVSMTLPDLELRNVVLNNLREEKEGSLLNKVIAGVDLSQGDQDVVFNQTAFHSAVGTLKLSPSNTAVAKAIVDYVKGLRLLLQEYNLTNSASTWKQIDSTRQYLEAARGDFLKILGQEAAKNEQVGAMLKKIADAEKLKGIAALARKAINEVEERSGNFIRLLESDQKQREEDLRKFTVVKDSAELIRAAVEVGLDGGEAKRQLERIQGALVTNAQPLAVAKSGNRIFYMVDAILAQNPRTPHFHVVNFGGGHYEKFLNPDSWSAWAIASRQLKKYSLEDTRAWGLDYNFEQLKGDKAHIILAKLVGSPGEKVESDEDDDETAEARALSRKLAAQTSSSSSSSSLVVTSE